MRLVGLTGGIGSGKSSVSDRLRGHGARIIDADAIVHELQEPGKPVFAAMVERWGDSIVTKEGRLDRPAVAAIVFADDVELKAIERIVHPAVRLEMDKQMNDASETDHIVILDIPLLAESRRTGGTGPDGRGTSAIIVVDCTIETAVQRLMTHRGFSEDDARTRVSKQATRQERLDLADFVVDNGGSIDQLDDEVDRCWVWLQGMPSTPWPPDSRVEDQEA